MGQGDGDIGQRAAKVDPKADFSAAGFGAPDLKAPPKRLTGEVVVAQNTPGGVFSPESRGAATHPPDTEKNYTYNADKTQFANDSPLDMPFWAGTLWAAKNVNNIGPLQSLNWYQRLSRKEYKPGDKQENTPIPEPRGLEGTNPVTRAQWEERRTFYLGVANDPTQPGVVENAMNVPGITPTQKNVLTNFKPQLEIMFNNPASRPHFSEEQPFDKGLPDIFQKGPSDLSSAGLPERPIVVDMDVTRPGTPITISARDIRLPPPTNPKSPEWLRGMDHSAETPANFEMVRTRELAVVMTNQRAAANAQENLTRSQAFDEKLRGRQLSAGAEVATFALAELAVAGIDELIPRDKIHPVSKALKFGGPFLMTVTGESKFVSKYGPFIGAAVYVGGYALSREFLDEKSLLMKRDKP